MGFLFSIMVIAEIEIHFHKTAPAAPAAPIKGAPALAAPCLPLMAAACYFQPPKTKTIDQTIIPTYHIIYIPFIMYQSLVSLIQWLRSISGVTSGDVVIIRADLSYINIYI